MSISIRKISLFIIIYACFVFSIRTQENTTFSYDFAPFLPKIRSQSQTVSEKPVILASIDKQKENIDKKTLKAKDNSLLIKVIKKKPSKNPNKKKEKIVEYVVKKGDCLSKIANYYGVNTRKLINENNLRTNKIFKGQKLKIPLSSSVPLIKPHISGGKLNWPLPFRGRISSGFGMRIHPITKLWSFHNGIDLPAPKNTKILAVADGKVYFSGYKYLSGRTIIIKHPNGMYSIYAHCNKLYVKKGDWVKQGKVIASVGLTGRTTGYHLHFGLKKRNKYLNPLKYLK